MCNYVFERVQSVVGASSIDCCRTHFDVEYSESENRLEVENEIQKLMTLKHPCVAVPFRSVVRQVSHD
jgi:hypothetical protein